MLKSAFRYSVFILLLPILAGVFSCSSGDDYYMDRDTVMVYIDDTVQTQTPLPPPVIRSFTYTVQIGAFKNKTNADNFAAEFTRKMNSVPDISVSSSGFYIVTTGTFSDRVLAESYLGRVKAQGFNDAFILTREK